MVQTDLTNFDFSKLKIGKSGRILRLLYDNEPLSFCTSALYMPFDVNTTNKEWSVFTEYSIECSLDSSAGEGMRTFLEQLDEKIEELLKGHPDVTSEFTFYKFFKENGNYPKRMRLQLPRDKYGNFGSFIFDHTKKKIPLTEDNINKVLSKGKVFKCIIECSKVYMYNGKAGSIWNINQLKLAEPSERPQQQTSQVDQVYSQMML